MSYRLSIESTATKASARLCAALVCAVLCALLLGTGAGAAHAAASDPVIEDQGGAYVVYANGTPITLEKGEAPDTTKVVFSKGGVKTPVALGGVEEFDLRASTVYGGTKEEDPSIKSASIAMGGGSVHAICGADEKQKGSENLVAAVSITGGAVNTVTGVSGIETKGAERRATAAVTIGGTALVKKVYGAKGCVDASVTVTVEDNALVGEELYGIYADFARRDYKAEMYSSRVVVADNSLVKKLVGAYCGGMRDKTVTSAVEVAGGTVAMLAGTEADAASFSIQISGETKVEVAGGMVETLAGLHSYGGNFPQYGNLSVSAVVSSGSANSVAGAKSSGGTPTFGTVRAGVSGAGTVVTMTGLEFAGGGLDSIKAVDVQATGGTVVGEMLGIKGEKDAGNDKAIPVTLLVCDDPDTATVNVFAVRPWSSSVKGDRWSVTGLFPATKFAPKDEEIAAFDPGVLFWDAARNRHVVTGNPVWPRSFASMEVRDIEIEAGARFSVSDGATFAVRGALINDGSLFIEGGGTLDFSGTLVAAASSSITVEGEAVGSATISADAPGTFVAALKPDDVSIAPLVYTGSELDPNPVIAQTRTIYGRDFTVDYYTTGYNQPNYEKQQSNGSWASAPILFEGTYRATYSRQGDSYSIEKIFEVTSPAAGELSRLGGDDRYATSVLVSRTANDLGCDTVIVARGDAFPDALASAGLAGVLDAQVLITPTSKLDARTEAEIKRLNAKRALIIGDEYAVSAEAFDGIAALVGGNAERISGPDRFATALAIFLSQAGAWGDTAVVASGTVAADTLTASPLAFALDAPVFLVDGDGNLSSDALSALSGGGFSRVLVMGSEASVSDGAEAALAGLGLNPERLGGPDRYATSRAVIDWALKNGFSATDIVVASGRDNNFPDALCASALAGRAKGLLALVDDGEVAGLLVSDVIAPNKGFIARVLVLGDGYAVSDEVYRLVEAALA